MNFHFRFNKFDIETHERCIYDWVAVYDGDSLNSPLIGKFCGDVVPDVIKTRSNSMLVEFITDYSVNKEGFVASYRTTFGEIDSGCHGDKPIMVMFSTNYSAQFLLRTVMLQLLFPGALQGCGGLLNSTSGRFGTIDATGNGNYEPGLDCQWQILVPDGQVATLTFESLDIERTPSIFENCLFDHVEVCEF